MKIGFNEATDRYCAGHSVMKDLELCEKNGFDVIDIQSECLNRDLEKGACTLEEMGEWFKTHHLKMASYNALCFFNMKQTQQEKDAIIEEFKEIVRRCGILGCNTVVIVPSVDIPVEATVEEIREDSVAVIKDLLKIAEPKGIKLSLEFCGSPSMCINQFKDAYDIVQQVNSPNVGLTLDQFHFHAMSSHWEDFEKADGKKIFIWHLDGSEHMPCGAPYYTDEKRLWPGDKNDCIDHKRYADTLKKIGFEGDCCILELFRPEYYELSVEENIKKSAEVTRAHVAKYCK